MVSQGFEIEGAFFYFYTYPPGKQESFTLQIVRADETLAELEDLSLNSDLAAKPLPKSMADYKNHPLLVLLTLIVHFQALDFL